MNGALIIRLRRELAKMLQEGELTIQDGIAAMREIDRLEAEEEYKIEQWRMAA